MACIYTNYCAIISTAGARRYNTHSVTAHAPSEHACVRTYVQSAMALSMPTSGAADTLSKKMPVRSCIVDRSSPRRPRNRKQRKPNVQSVMTRANMPILLRQMLRFMRLKQASRVCACVTSQTRLYVELLKRYALCVSCICSFDTCKILVILRWTLMVSLLVLIFG